LTAGAPVAYANAMLSLVARQMHRIALLVVLTVALVGTGFAHRLSVGDGERLAFLWAIGATAADICDDASPGDEHHGAQCQACQIAGAADLPVVLGVPHRLDLTRVARAAVAWTSSPVLRPFDHSHAPQAPPLV
jgi:hypothetical protein